MLPRNIAEAFKTPGKLRGKTPRTARKRNPLEIREVVGLVAPDLARLADTYSSLSMASLPQIGNLEQVLAEVPLSPENHGDLRLLKMRHLLQLRKLQRRITTLGIVV